MTTLPFSRNAPLTPVRLLEALCAARPNEAQLGPREGRHELLSPEQLPGGTLYTARELTLLDWDSGADLAGLLLRDTPDPKTGEYLVEWSAERETCAVFGAIWRRCWDQGYRLTTVCEPCNQATTMATQDVTAIVQGDGHTISTTATHPALAALLAYAQLVTGLRLPAPKREG
ncbi:hypothetical protein GO986_16450 [Deinococcus sp. HMF7620]|uniref:Uncharacterized protein n=1 Tax=Deinococcus arboris TaxID=2682977 RepID=A0A7C9LNT7_9DEIO|nr:hypothetical protein [Deinococcus arboris]MVN88337.1 hypothetical protein [Deinococcus arboris]